jgi:hypothetical protein
LLLTDGANLAKIPGGSKGMSVWAPRDKETAMTTYILVIGVGLYLAVAALFYLFLLATAKPESQRS